MSAQQWDAARYAQTARFVAALGVPLIEALAPQAGERILDLGCGDGVLSAAILATGAEVVGIDASVDMVAAARARGIDARCGRGEAIDDVDAFDAVFSNAALHWMTDLDTVFANVARALRPGGRFVAEMGGAGNVVRVVTALNTALHRRGVDAPCPWTFPEPDTVAVLLTQRNFVIDSLERFERPTPIPGDLADWIETFAGAHLSAVPAAQRPGLIEEVRAALRPALHSGDGWVLDYVRLRFAAHLAIGRDVSFDRIDPPSGHTNRP